MPGASGQQPQNDDLPRGGWPSKSPSTVESILELLELRSGHGEAEPIEQASQEDRLELPPVLVGRDVQNEQDELRVDPVGLRQHRNLDGRWIVRGFSWSSRFSASGIPEAVW